MLRGSMHRLVDGGAMGDQSRCSPAVDAQGRMRGDCGDTGASEARCVNAVEEFRHQNVALGALCTEQRRLLLPCRGARSRQ
jgi:hypothetical protein